MLKHYHLIEVTNIFYTNTDTDTNGKEKLDPFQNCVFFF